MDALAVQRTKKDGSPVVIAERYARHVLQRRSRNPSEVLSGHHACREGGLNGIDERVIDFCDDRIDFSVGAHANDHVAH
jgi:hypothetical protein